MEDWHWQRRLAYGALQAVGLGFVAAAFEMTALAASMRLPLGAVDVLALGAVDLLLVGAFGGLLGIGAGAIHPVLRKRPTSVAVGLQLAVVGTLLCGLHLWQRAFELLAEGQPVGAAAMAAMPFGFAGVIYFNAKYWLRRAEIGRAPALPWLAAAGGFAALIVGGAAVVYPQRGTGGDFALDDDKNAVIVTIDGLRHDADVPSLRALGEEEVGITFLDAVTPSPHDRPANATVLTGLHPLRHKVLVDGDALSRSYATLAEVLAEEGYATAGFASSTAVGASSGLDQGFLVYDDDLAPLPGLGRLGVVRLLPLSGHRAPDETVARFGSWLGRHADKPFFAWVHLRGGDAEVDAAVASVRAALEGRGVLDETLLVVAGTHGHMAGEHELEGAVGLYDPVVRVPLVMRAPGVRVDVPRVAPQVRLMDVAASVLDWLRLDPLGQSEGVSLVTYGQGLRKATIWCALVGLGPDGELHVGMRNNGVKYLRRPDGSEALYDLAADPGERADVSAQQPSTLTAARQLMASEVAALEALRASRGR